MGQVLGKDNIQTVTISDTTELTLPASRITLGGQQYRNTADIIVDLTTTGANGLDTGSLAADTLYHLYAVLSAGSLALVASTNSTTPTGFTLFKKIAKFRTFLGGATVAAIRNTLIGDSEKNQEETTDWATHTPSDPSQFTSSSSSARWRMIRANMEVDVNYVLSSTVSGLVRPTDEQILPLGYSFDADELVFSAVRGSWFSSDSSELSVEANNAGIVTIESSGILVLTISRPTSLASSATNLDEVQDDHPHIWASGDTLRFSINAPIREFSGLFGD